MDNAETNNLNLKLRYFQEQLQAAARAKKALEISFKRAQSTVAQLKINAQATLSTQDEETLEALTARFARCSDLLIQKVARALDALELVDEGTLLDRLSRLEKRKLIPDMNQWVRIRELRNEIAHEYLLEDLRSLQIQVFDHAPQLFSFLDAAQKYADSKFSTKS